jgi:molybdate/tungstate transport system permease protein
VGERIGFRDDKTMVIQIHEKGGKDAAFSQSVSVAGRSRSRFRFFHCGGIELIFLSLGGLILAFIAFPILKMIFASDPSILKDSLFDREVAASIALTLYAALIATAIGFALGVPLAYLLAKSRFSGKRLVEGLIDLPIVIPHSAAGIALLFVFGRNYFLGQAFESAGIRFLDSLAGIVIAMLFVSVPFLIDSAKDGFEKVDPRLEKVARTLGASPWQTFIRISFPLAWRSIMAGNIMMWARALSEFGAVIIIAYHPMIAPVLVYEKFETYGLNYARPIAVILILISMLVFVVLRLLVYRGEKA